MSFLTTYWNRRNLLYQEPMRVIAWSGIAAWSAIIAFHFLIHELPLPLWSAAVGASVTGALALISRNQAKRVVVLDLHKEFYSHPFAEARRTATRFLHRHAGTDWVKDPPYQIRDPEGTLDGYSQVLRFWHRVAVLYFNGAAEKGLCQRLLSREFGYWYGFVFESMEGRKDMYTLDLLVRLRQQLAIGEGRKEFAAGLSDGRAKKRFTPAPKWRWTGKRWSTTHRQAN